MNLQLHVSLMVCLWWQMTRSIISHNTDLVYLEIQVSATFFIFVTVQTEIHYIYLSLQHSSLVLLSCDIKSVYVDYISIFMLSEDEAIWPQGGQFTWTYSIWAIQMKVLSGVRRVTRGAQKANSTE